MDWYTKSNIKTASRNIYYHGTSYNRLRSILSQGMVPDHKNKAWGEDPDVYSGRPSRVSFDGVYLTTNIEKAYDAVSQATQADYDRMNGKIDYTMDGVIVALQIETNSLTSDEDSVLYDLRDALRDIISDGEIEKSNVIKTYILYRMGRMDDAFESAVHRYIDNLFENQANQSDLFGETQLRVRNNVFQILVELLKRYLERIVAYHLHETKGISELQFYTEEFEENGLDISSVPDPATAEENFREYFDLASRKLSVLAKKPSARNDTARYLSPITFRGANRIVAIISFRFFDQKKSKNGRDGYYLKFHYCISEDIKNDVINDWQASLDPNIKIITGNVNDLEPRPHALVTPQNELV